MNSHFSTPTNDDEAHALALHYVSKHIERGYTAADAKREAFAGMAGPNQPGYLIRAGKISVPGLSPKWTFDFAELAKEITQPKQLALF